jgi:hypothetical protein
MLSFHQREKTKMTWKTSCGNRILDEHEQFVLVGSLGFIIDHYSDERYVDKNAKLDSVLGNNAFERLNENQKIALFWKVCYYLTEDTGDDIPALTNLNESAIYYVFQHFIDHELELFLEAAFDERRRATVGGVGAVGRGQLRANHEPPDEVHILDVLLQCVDLYFKDEEGVDYDDDRSSHYYYPTSRLDKNRKRWVNLIESLADRILWDRDFEEDFEDMVQPGMHDTLMISSDYYVKYTEDSMFPTARALERFTPYLHEKSHLLWDKLVEKSNTSKSKAASAYSAQPNKKKDNNSAAKVAKVPSIKKETTNGSKAIITIKTEVKTIANGGDESGKRTRSKMKDQMKSLNDGLNEAPAKSTQKESSERPSKKKAKTSKN